MDDWTLKQLRAFVLSDLNNLIPSRYFEQEIEELKYSDKFKSYKYLSFENNWGYLATKLGKKLYFEPIGTPTPREVAASEVLMHLGMLACSQAQLSICEQVCKLGNDQGYNVVAEQLKTDHIPTFQNNIKEALKQYFLHLTKEESKPYKQLIDENIQTSSVQREVKEDIVELKPNFMGIGLNINAILRRLYNNK